MASVTLSKHDVNVLEKIKDPDFDPSSAVLIDPSINRDPHITNKEVYEKLVQREQGILLSLQQLELQLAGLKPQPDREPALEYKACIEKLGKLIDEFPNYASARNNRAQALRRLYGDAMLLTGGGAGSSAILKDVDDSEVTKAAAMALADLDKSVDLLTPFAPFAAMSPQQAKTLSLAHTQRAAIYHTTAKQLSNAELQTKQSRKESSWERIQFEEAASRDFAMGGRYGCDVAKGLAVSTNPTAKLCGQMVREAMKKEYGPEYGA